MPGRVCALAMVPYPSSNGDVMHQSHLRSAVEGRRFAILYVSGSHIEMIGEVDHGDVPNRKYFLTLTAKSGSTVHSGLTLDALADVSESLYLSVRDYDLSKSVTSSKVAEMELLQPDGSLVPSFQDLGPNVVPLRRTA